MATYAEVCARWAQDDPNARVLKAQRLYYVRHEHAGWAGATYGPENVLYSYGRHFPLAAFQTAPGGRRVCMVTTQKTSVSTGNHRRYAVAAAERVGIRIVWAEHVTPSDVPYGRNLHETNVAAFLDKARELLAKSRRARTNKDHLLEQALGQIANAREYAKVWRVKCPLTDELKLAYVTAKVTGRAA